jgi:hypothetical protein
MTTYYAKLTSQNDGLNRPIAAVYRGAQQHPSHPLIGTSNVPLPAYERLLSSTGDWVLVNDKLQPSFEKLKADKIAQLERTAAIALKAGITVGNITLAADDTDQAAFTKLLVLLREAEDMQPTDEAKEAFRASLQTIADKSGTPHQLTVTQLRALVLQYGQAIQTAWGALAARKAAIRAAATMEALAAA